MKKITLFTTTIICLGLISNAQITKGSLFLGGSFGGSSNDSKNDAPPNYETKSSGFSVYPQVGKAIATNKIVGLSLGYSKSTTEANSNGLNQENSTYSAGVFYRRYYPIGTRFYLFGQGNLGWNQTKQNYENNNFLQQTSRSNNIDFNITPGISYAASQRVYLEASLNALASVGYSTGTSKNYNQSGTVTGTATQKSFYIAGNGNGFSNITIGLRFIIPKK